MRHSTGLLTLVLLLIAACSTSQGVAAKPSPAVSPSASSSPAASRLVAVDWANTKAVDVPGGRRGSQSPDGSRFFSGGQVLTIGGDPVGAVKSPTKAAWRWADDSRHLCSAYLDSPTPPNDSVRTPTGLYETLPGSDPALIAQAGYLAGQSGPFVLGCSFGHGTATVGEACVNSLCETWTVDLLSHKVLSHLGNLSMGSANSYLEGAVSPDGTLLAVFDSTAGASTIYRTADGAVVTTLTGSRVVAFTAFDDAVLVTHATGPAELLDIHGKSIATLPGNQVQSSLVEPGGSRIAVALGDPGAGADGWPKPADLVLVGTHGKVVSLAQGVLPQF